MHPIGLTDYELRKINQIPDALRAIADYHDMQSTLASGMDMPESESHHAFRSKVLRNEADRIDRFWDRGEEAFTDTSACDPK